MNRFDEINERIKHTKKRVSQLMNDERFSVLDQKVFQAFNKATKMFKEYFNNTERFKQEPGEFDYEFVKGLIVFFKDLEVLPDKLLTNILGDFTKGLTNIIGEQTKIINNSYSEIKALTNQFRAYKQEIDEKHESLTNKFNTLIEENRSLKNNLSKVLAVPLKCVPGGLIQKLIKGFDKISDSIKESVQLKRNPKAPDLDYQEVYNLLSNNPAYNKISYFKKELSKESQALLDKHVSSLVKDEIIKRGVGKLVLLKPDLLYSYFNQYGEELEKKTAGLDEKILNEYCIRLELRPKKKDYVINQFPINRANLTQLTKKLISNQAILNNELINPEAMYSVINAEFNFQLKSLTELKEDIIDYLTSYDEPTTQDVYREFSFFNKDLLKDVIHSLKEDGSVNTKQRSRRIWVV